MKLLHKLQNSFDYWVLLITSVVFFLLRFPSFFEPYWYGDEGVYEVLGFGMRHGRLLYQGIWDNKPPLLYVLYALVDGNQTLIRILSFVVGLAAVWIFYFLAKRLFEKKWSIAFATSFFALLLGLPLLEGNIANAENFMVLPIVAAVFLIVRTIQEKKYHVLTLFSAGILLGLSFLIKVVGVFDFAAVFLFIGISMLSQKQIIITKLFQKLFFFTVGFVIPILVTVGFFISKGILSTFIQSAFFSNVGYVNYGNQLFIPQGLLILKLLLLSLVVIFLFFKRYTLSMTHLLIYLWIGFSLFNAFFSQRPYTHYTLVLLGSVGLLIGLLFEKKKLFLHVLLLGIIVVLVVKNFWLYDKTIGYYVNFARELTNAQTTTQYQSFFDKGVPRDYAIVDFLKANLSKNETAFLWTNSAQMYYLLQQLPPVRYTTAYHITANANTLAETSHMLQNTYPKFVVILPNAPSFPFRMKNYSLRLSIDNGLIYERTF